MTTRIIPLAVLVACWTLAGCEDLTPVLQGAAEGLRQAGVQPLGATPVLASPTSGNAPAKAQPSPASAGTCTHSGMCWTR
jgi:hypothetical protein